MIVILCCRSDVDAPWCGNVWWIRWERDDVGAKAYQWTSGL